MKYYILAIAISFSIVAGCKSKKSANTAGTGTNTIIEPTAAPAKTTGKVSHQFRSTGCATVIVVNQEGQKESLILIPKDMLPSAFDVDGTEIHFNYHTLRMPQPKGCDKGIPAEITDITKK